MGDANNNASDAGVAVQQATLPPETTTTDDKQHTKGKKLSHAEEVLKFMKDVQSYGKANFELMEMYQEAIEKEAEAVCGRTSPDNVHVTAHTWGACALEAADPLRPDQVEEEHHAAHARERVAL